jgi:hypothetical protein
MRRALCLLLLGCLLPTAAAASDGSSFAGTDGTLYLHIAHTPSFRTWSNTLASDPNNQGTDDGNGASGLGVGATSATYTFTMDPPLSAAAQLTKGADVTFDLWVGASKAGQAGQVTVTATLLAGDATLAAATSSAVTFAGDMHEVVLKTPARADSVAPGSNLAVRLDLRGTGSAVHVGNGGRTQSKVQLPLAAAAPGRSYQTLSGPSITISNTFDNATTRTDVYNWTTPVGRLDFSFSGHSTAGTVSVTVRDGNGRSGYAKRPGPANPGRGEADLAPGNWTITVDFAGFKGTFGMSIGPPPSDSSTATDTTSTDSGASSATAASTTKGAPALGPVALAAALGLALLGRRRR